MIANKGSDGGRGSLNFHIHINAYRVPIESRRLLGNAGYFFDPLLAGHAGHIPPIHYSFETSNLQLAKNAWKVGINILSGEPDFFGYITRETISERFVARYQNSHQRYSINDLTFPLLWLNTSSSSPTRTKRADLHIKRNRVAPRDGLDLVLQRAGFQDALSPRNRIYSLQLECTKDAASLFSALRNYFDKMGGIKQISYEIVGRVVCFPSEFVVPHIVTRGGYEILDSIS